jgi:hypothetical protein
MSGTKILDIGNTKVVTHMIKELIDTELFKIRQSQPYSKC